MSSAPATGNQVIVGFAIEQEEGVPNPSATRVYLKAAGTTTADLIRAEVESGQLNASGYPEPGLPAAVSAPVSLPVLVTASSLLEIYENLLQGNAKSTLEAGEAFQYTFTQSISDIQTSLDWVIALPAPGGTNRLDRWYLYGSKVSSISHSIGQNTPINATLDILAQHGTKLGVASADGSNTGSYTEGPIIRGPVRRRFPNATLHVDVTQAAASGLEFKAEISDGTPEFNGTAQAAVYDSDGNGVWQNLKADINITGTVSVTASTAAVTGTGTLFTSELEVGDFITIAGETIKISAIASDTALTLASNHSAGASADQAHLIDYDLGYWDENRDPVEIIWPGTAAGAQADIDVGDLWTFAAPGAWADPSPTYLSGQRYTSAHWFLDYRKVGGSTWNSFEVQSGDITLSWPVTPDTGSGSRYPNGIDRDGVSEFTLSLPRKHRDLTFIEFLEAHERMELRLRFLGQHLGNPANDNRESITYTFPYAALQPINRPVTGAGPIIETLPFRAESNPSTGASPVTVVIVSDRDYTIAT